MLPSKEGIIMILNTSLHHLETAIHEAWPASVNEYYENWIIRSHYGVTKRANSVLTIGSMPKNTNWLTEIEQFFELRTIAPCFYMSELSPPELDPVLEEAGYEIVGKMDLLVASSNAVKNSTESKANYFVQIDEEVEKTWIHTFLTLEQFDPQLFSAYEEIFTNISGKKAFFTLYKNEDPVAVASVALQGNLGYVANVVVDDRFRRQGLATQLLSYLAAWTYNERVDYLVLQVLDENTKAKKLYEQLHFTKAAQCYYRMKQLENN